MLTLVLLPCWLFAYSALILQKLADYSTNLFLLCQGGVMRLLLFVCQSFVQLLSVCMFVCLSVSRITQERVYGCQPNVVGVDKGWLARSG